MEFSPNGLYEACEKGKSKRASHKKKTMTNITEPLQLLHMDFFGPVNVMSMPRKKYDLVIVGDYSGYTWVLFLHSKDEAPDMITDHINKIELEAGGISRQFSAPRTSQQNGIVERKNRTLVEAVRTMLNKANIPTYFWAEAINTVCYTQNRTLINKLYEKTPYELMANKKPSLIYFHVFGGKCFVLKDDVHLGKFDVKAKEFIFLGYSLESKAYIVYVMSDQKVVESLNVTFDDAKLPSIQKEYDSDIIDVEDLSDREDEPEVVPDNNDNGNDLDDHNSDADSEWGAEQREEQGSGSQTHHNSRNVESLRSSIPRHRVWSKDHPRNLILSNPESGVKTRRATINECFYSGILSQMEPKKVDEALGDPDWVIGMQEELNQFERQKV
ncbi:hypothetical protein AgCh_005094 [Apium graveolens]